MKIFKHFIICALLSISFLSMFQEGNTQSSRMKDRFYLGAINYLWVTQRRTATEQGYYQNLSYNMMQSYCSRADTTKTADSYDGGFFGSTSLFIDCVFNTINFWNTTSGQNSLIFERERVLRAAYGQRSDYSAYNSGNISYWRSQFPSYGFDSTETGNNFQDIEFANGNWVRVCKASLGDTAGFMVKSLYENCEQVNRIEITNTNISGARMFSDVKQLNYNYKWFIKPRLRVNPDSALVHFNDTLCILYVKNFNGQYQDSFAIKGKSFFTYDNQQYHYDGRYIEMFYHIYPYGDHDNTPTAFSVSALDLITGRTTDPNNLLDSKVDYRLKWCGKVDMWLDYIRVDDEWAHYLFTDSVETSSENKWKFHQKIDSEVVAFSNTSGFGYFWIDEFAYNNLPCVAEVNKLIGIKNPNTSFITTANIDGIVLEKSGLRNTSGYNRLQLIDKLINDGILTNIFLDGNYPFLVQVLYPKNLSLNGKYPIFDYMHKASSNEYYNCGDNIHNGIQEFIQIYGLNVNKANRNHIGNLTYGYMLQVHSDEAGAPNGNWALREPTNEEIRVQCYLGMALGAKIINQYSYYSCAFKNNYHSWGLTSEELVGNEYQPRDSNYYGQKKWDSVVALNNKIKELGNFMYPLDNTNKHLLYDKTVSVNTGELPNAQEYIFNIKSKVVKPESGVTYLIENGDTLDFYNVNNLNQSSKRFWEIGFFNPNPSNPENSFDKSKYFLAVNKRCAPVNTEASDERELLIKFDAQKLQNFNNWKIIDGVTNLEILTFDKSSSEYFNLGRFLPGEGKLFKLAPVMQEGGTFVCNEEIGNISFDCKGTVNNAGYNITINAKTTIQFHSGTEINMTHGRLICGSETYASNDINLTGKDNAFWHGLNLEECDTIRIYKTNIANAQAAQFQDSLKYAINLKNCTNVVIQNSTIHSYGVGAINSIVNTIKYANTVNYISGNDFILDDFTDYTVRFIQTGYTTVSVRIENNTFSNNNNYTGNCAILLSGVLAGSIINNYITDYYTGINLLLSSVDLYGNTLISNLVDSKLINAVSGSALIMGESNTKYADGYNFLNTTADTSYNIYLDNSAFYTLNGINSFIIKDNDPSSYHFGGNVSSPSEQAWIDASNNCYYTGENINTNILLYWHNTNDLITVITDPMAKECLSKRPSQMEVFVSDGGINDTLYIEAGGSGGGEKGEVNTSLKSLYSDLCYQTRKRNYDSIILNAAQLINLYPDSLKSLDAISKLYFASLKKDSAGSKINPLKTYFEALILNNPNNTALISKSFYFIQKCKVALKQYTSAMAGFQQIIQENPYSYEALLASWDYAATSLLMNGGNGGGFNIEQSSIYDIQSKDGDNSEDFEFYLNSFMSCYDSTKFTKSDRVKLFDITKKTFETKKKDEIKQIEILQTRSSKGDREAQKELYKKKTINEVAKANKPKSYDEYIRIISNNIDKIFTNPKLKGNKQISNNIIPKEFSLYQNYPNPFNPVTKISFDLPKDAKIKLIVYDILGREVTRLLNSEFKQAGKHIIEFDAMKYNLASGVYFYRIESEDFNAVKKMVIIK